MLNGIFMTIRVKGENTVLNEYIFPCNHRASQQRVLGMYNIYKQFEHLYSTLWLAEAALCNAEAAMCYFSTLIIAVLYISALCTAHIIVVRHQYKVHLKAIRYED